jgi:hypothetical protein
VLFSTGHAKFADLGLGGYAVLSCRTPYSTSSLTYSARALADLTDDYKRAVELNRRFVYRDSDWLQVSGPRAAMDRYWQQVSDAVRLGDAQKEQLNAIYRASLPAQCQLPPEFQTWRFNIRVPAKLSLIRKIFTAGLFASSHYAPLTGVFADGDAPEATRLHQEILNLFNDRYFDAERAARIASIVTRHIADHSR